MDIKAIHKQLVAIKKNALAKYSHFHVAALLETADGKLISGFNIETSSYGLTICAERVALFKALSEGEADFKRIYIMADGDEPCSPCGACRQVLMDYAPDIEVVMISESGKQLTAKLSELLPFAFKDERLKQK